MAFLEIIEGANKGTVVRLKPENFIGRSSENAIALPDTDVSRQHAVIRTTENYFTICDLGSANGTLVNGRGLHRLVPQPLYEGDVILISTSKMRFCAEGMDPLATKKPPANSAMTIAHASKVRGIGGLSMVLTSETYVPEVSATMDASRSMLEIRDDQSAGTGGLVEIVKRLQTMVKVSNNLGELTKPEALLEKIMESIFDIFPHADRACIMLRNNKSGEMVPVLGRSRMGKQEMQEDFPVSRTIINTVMEKKQSILSSDAQKDGRFLAQQSIVSLSIRSLMCAPFICKEELLGIISVDTMSGHHAFNAEDLAMLTGIAAQAAIALKNAELYSAVENETNLRAKLSRYLSKDVVEGVIDGTIPLHLGGEKKYGTVFFCDIVGFTSIAETLSAVEVVKRLNRYFSITTEIITKNSGTLHKFGGDMIMAFWNVMVVDENAQLNAIRASVAMQSEVWKFDCDLHKEEQSPIYLGIGCNTGEFAGGNVGGEDRMEYTIIGDQVNLAQRIESLASRWQVFVAESTLAPASHKCCALKLPPVHVKGKSKPIQIFSIRGVLGEEHEMYLNIPVVISDDAKTMHDPGFLVKNDISGNRLELLCLTLPQELIGQYILLEYDLPELPNTLYISALIQSIDPQTPNKSFSTAILNGPYGTADAMSLLRPGSILNSPINWDDMKRH